MRLKLSVKWNMELIIAWLFLTPQINFFLANFLDMYGIPTVTPFIYSVAVFLGSVSYVKTLNTRRGILFTWIIILLIISSALVNSQVLGYMFDTNIIQSNVLLLMLLYLPMFLLLQQRIDLEVLMKYLWRGSLVTLSLAIVVFVTLLSSRSSVDYMSFAYMMLSPIMICFIERWRKKGVLLAFPVIASGILFVIGCRGAVVALAVFFVLCFLWFYLKGGRKGNRLFLKAALLIAVIITGLNMNSILRIIVGELNSVGFSSRTVEKILLGNGAFMQSKGRQSIWNQAVGSIGVFGKGLFGDRTVLLDEYHNPTYPHNFILEIMIDFGMIVGPILILLFVFLIMRALFIALKSGEIQRIQMAFAMVAILFVKHMVSASFLTSFDFWFYVGLALNWIIYQSDCPRSEIR